MSVFIQFNGDTGAISMSHSLRSPAGRSLASFRRRRRVALRLAAIVTAIGTTAWLALPAQASAASAAPAKCCSVTVNGPAVTMKVTRQGASVKDTFRGTVGEQVTEVLTNVVTSDQGCETLTLIGPDGSVDSGSSCGNGNDVGVGPDTLTVSGTYKVFLALDNTATGSSKLWVSAPVSLGTVAVNGPAVAMNVTRVGQGVKRTFSGKAGEHVSEVVSNISTSDQGCETVTLLNPSGDTGDSGSNCGDGNPVGVGPDRLSKTCTYTGLFQVDVVATGTGKLKVST
jgi:hypothetical protein